MSSKVGVEPVDHTTPLELTVPPPTSVTVPPLWALSTVISLIVVVVKVANTASSIIPSQSLSIPSCISVTSGLTCGFWSSQSRLLLEYPIGKLQDSIDTSGFPNPSESES